MGENLLHFRLNSETFRKHPKMWIVSDRYKLIKASRQLCRSGNNISGLSAK